MRSLFASLLVVMAFGCGGRIPIPDADAGTGGTTGGGTGGTATTGGGGGSGGSGGVGGSSNPGSDFSACTGAGQCMLVPAKCCACGLLSSDQVAAINATKRGDYNTKICGPDPAPCPPCVPIIDPNLFARCEGQTCRIADLRTDPTFTKCGTDQDCMLRKGLECCECGAEGGWVAISRVGAMVLASQVCGGAICPACVPVPPAGTTAVCRNGACTMTP